MCGRYAHSRTAQQLTDDFAATLGASAALIEADYNMAPTKRAPLIVARRASDSGATARELQTAHWGLVPSWAADPAVGSRAINARSETAHEKPTFREAFARRRAVIPLDGFYEWYQPPSAGIGPLPPKQPFFISSRTPDGIGDGLGVAGLYEFWRPAAGGDWLATFTILTTAARGEDGRLHDRAPWIVPPEHVDAWLDPAPYAPEELFALLVPATPGRLHTWPVSTAVNHVRNNGPDLVRPLAATS
ncbi:MAG: SOS response-associated peptidase [Aeromicrobium sp.]|uniref:SOS response-associated peptidase n=1 Tax=Aeromicrobium sp. TaxID=1871063 RepID=UPI0039E30BDF